MFPSRQGTDIVVRTLLIAVILCNALLPEAALALPSSGQELNSSLPTNTANTEQSNGLVARLSNLFQNSFQDITPTTSPTETETPTPETLSTSSPSSENTPIPSYTPEYILTPTASTPEYTQTPTLTQTPVPTQTSTTSAEISQLSIEFSAAPNNPKIGDRVTFTLEIRNDGTSPSTGLGFSNFLPDGFNYVTRNNDEFTYDPHTHELTWAIRPEMSLLPGEKLVLTYTIVLTPSEVDDIQIIDTANIRANNLAEPIAVETSLLISQPGNSLTPMDARGGKATGLAGHVQLQFPEKSLVAQRVISIRDLREQNSSPRDEEPWIVFELELHIPQVQDGQASAAPDMNDTTSKETATTILQLDATPVPTDEAPSLESDSLTPLMPVDAVFDEPVELSVSLAGITDLATLGAEIQPFLVTLDETSGTWVRIPLKTIDREANTITAELTHFSTWGVGLGPSFPQNGANVLLFDSAYPSLFTGNSNYSIPLWTPPGRNGMQPNLTLSYSSGAVNGILGDIQSSWVGMGWNIDSVEIARKITNGSCDPCGGGSYGYENEFLLLINGTGYELIVDSTDPRFYHTKPESFMIVRRHNTLLESLFPGQSNPSPSNATGEWWEVREKDGKKWRLGFTPESEQLAAMKGYPGDQWTSTYLGWGALGYAGHAADRVALRWRADQVLDTYGNGMSFSYWEETRPVKDRIVTYDRASYLDLISYTDNEIGPLYGRYMVVFERESRGGVDVPTTHTDWDNWETERLDRIDIYYDFIRSVWEYRLDYTNRYYSDDGKTWQTTTLQAVTASGMRDLYNVDNAPSIFFTYDDYNNRATHTGWQEWAYPRLTTISNGWEGTATYTYANDGRPDTSWYNWRVTTLDVADGVSADPMKTTFTYSTPCYKVINPPDDWTCNGTNTGELVGYGQTTATTKDFNGTTILAISVHKFHTERKKAGREYEVQHNNASGITLSKTTTNFAVIDLQNGAYFIYPDLVEKFLLNGTLERIRRTTYFYDSTFGNLQWEKEYDGSLSLYRETTYEYKINSSWIVWILNTVSRRTLKDGNGVVISQQEYGYNGNLPGSGWMENPKPTLSRIVNGTQTIDTTYHYDGSGNLVETRLHKAFGTTNNLPSGSYNSYFTSYTDDATTSEDNNLQTYPTSVTNPLGHVTRTHYDYGTGWPTEVTDPNGNKTTTAYDALGRILEVKYPGYNQPNIKYTYPQLTPGPIAYTYDVPAPFAVKMEILDESSTPFVYRSAWQVMDGLGRVIQTQVPYETAGNLVLTDISYDARGKTLYGGLPRTVSGTGGTHFAPNWGSVPHTTSAYDALGRVLTTQFPDNTSKTIVYFGLRTGIWDQNNHKTVQENDAFGRLIKVEEWKGASLQGGDSTGQSLYSATTYEYDQRDLLKLVTDAAGNETKIDYDVYGRKIKMTDPDLGVWHYRYDTLGNLTAQIDAKLQAINLYYDDLNRLKGKTYSTVFGDPSLYQPPTDPGEEDYEINYYYDGNVEPNGLGHRTSMVDASGTTTWNYNALGQVIEETRNIEGNDYSLNTHFDAFGRPLSQDLPNGEKLKYNYNDMGALSSLRETKTYNSTYVSEIHYNPNGQIISQLLGTGLRQQFCYDDPNPLRLTRLRTYPNASGLPDCNTTAANPLLDFSYSYQPNGNISQIVDPVRSETLSYAYDDLDRLLSVNGSYNQSYTYDMTGSMTSKGIPTSPGTTGLVAWWDMDQISGSRLDSHGSNHLTDNNTVASSASLRGNAASFVPVNLESLSIPDNAALSTGDIDFTLVASVYLNSTANTMIIANKGLPSSSTRDYILYLDSADSKFKFSVGNGTVSGIVPSQETITAGRWYTVIAWHDSVSNTLNLQVNNGNISSVNYSSGAMDTTYPLTIGAHSGGLSVIDGKIDQVALYKRVLTPYERIWMYNNGSGRSYADLVTSNPGTTNLMAWWSMNETGGARSDSHGSNHLTDNNTVGSEPGLQGNAASFVTANLEYLSVVDNAALSTGDIDFTLAADVYLDSTSSIMIIANKGLAGSSTRDYVLYFDPVSSKFIFSVGNGTVSGSVSSLETITAGRWYTVAAWHSSASNSLNIQVNNATVSTASYASGAMDTTYPLTIGAHNGGTSALNGQIDEVLLYKRVLTSGERTWLYNNGLGRAYADFDAPTPGAGSTYTYGDPGPAHAVTSLSTGETYTYDANGNMTCRVEGGITYKQDYNIENMLIAVSRMIGNCTTGTVLETTSFVYDGDGNLVKKYNPDGSRTIYVGGIYEVDKSSGRTVTHTRVYYPAGGAMRIDGTLYYVLKDHLGSASVVTDASGTIIGEQRYYPFGETRFATGSMYTDRLYTGQREMANLGIYHYNARFYSPYINHFISADTIIPNPINPQNLNRYSYVTNNPLRYTDPTGHMRVDDEFGGGDVYTSPISNNNNNNHNDDEDDNTQQSPPPNTESGQSTNSSFPSPNAWVISFSYSAGFLAWYRSWSIDIVFTNDEIGFFHVDAIGPGFGRLEVPSTIPQRRMDTSFASPSVGGTVFGGCVWGNPLNESVQNYQGPSLVEGGTLVISGEWFESVNPRTGAPDGSIVGAGIGIGPSFPPAEAHRMFVDTRYLGGFSFSP